MTNPRLYFVVLAYCGGVLGCSSPVDTSEDTSVAESERDPLIITENRLWARSDFPLHVCFQSTGDGTAADRDAARAAVEGAWQLPGSIISFTGWDVCADDANSGDIRVFMDSSVGRANSPYGTDNRISGKKVNWRTPASSYHGHLTYMYIHEFGHALGLEHEMDRPDAICVYDQAPRAFDAVTVTPYDPEAIENYCAPFPTVISPYEYLFTQMIYPAGGNPPEYPVGGNPPFACKSGCFSTPPSQWGNLAQKTIMRSNAVMTDYFSLLGAYPWWDSSGVVWKSDGYYQLGTVSSGPDLVSASLIPQIGTTSYVTYLATISYNNTTVEGHSTVTVSDSQWTAIAMNVLAPN